MWCNNCNNYDEDQGCIVDAFPCEMVYEKMKSELYSLKDKFDSLEKENKTIKSRYEKVRKMYPADFARIYMRNLSGEASFDQLIDDLIDIHDNDIVKRYK